MFDDEKIPDDTSMNALAHNYALQNVVKVNKVSTQHHTNTDAIIWSQYNELTNLLSRLSNSINRCDFREYFTLLLPQNQQELQSLIALYPALDQSNATNPIFNASPGPSIQSNLRSYLILELRIVQSLISLFDAETESSRKTQLLNFINRHINNIITLLSRTNTR
ncbi:MAG: hypothetical protein IKC79_00115 [Clostridia bacterium]|nr:hypothetical protein [Clostridia bacterium]